MGLNPHGGFRPNSGRKAKSEKYKGPIAAAEDRIADRLTELIDLAFELANGVTVQEATPQGGTRVYTRSPDRRAIIYLIDRIMGKPTERVEHMGEDGEAIEVNTTVREVAARNSRHGGGRWPGSWQA